MSIKRSASTEVRSLLAALAGRDAVKREAAIARLAVIGPRATDRLLDLYGATATSDETRLSILRVFEAVADERTLPHVRRALAGSPEMATAAIAAVRGFLGSAGTAATEALDALVTIVVDQQADRRVRLAALDALRETPGDVQARLTAALAADPDPVVRARVQAPDDEAAPAAMEWQEALAGRMGGDPVTLLIAARTKADAAPLGELRRMIDEARVRERAATAPPDVIGWRELRGHLHQALALRGSTVALYDLRETLEGAAEVLPGTFVAAVQTIGDESCLEPIAGAYTRVDDEHWRAQLAGAFAAIAKREKAAARQAAMRRVEARWPEAAGVLSTTSRTTPRRTTRRRT